MANANELTRTVPAADLLGHELSRQVYTNSTTKFHVFGDNGERVYEINVSSGRKKFARTDSFCVYWAVRRGWSMKTGWKTWQCWLATEAEAIAFAQSKLVTLRKWAAEKAEAA